MCEQCNEHFKKMAEGRTFPPIPVAKPEDYEKLGVEEGKVKKGCINDEVTSPRPSNPIGVGLDAPPPEPLGYMLPTQAFMKWAMDAINYLLEQNEERNNGTKETSQ